MAIWTPRSGIGFGWSYCSVGATRPAASYGTTVTPAQNSKGSYVEVISGANCAKDVFGLLINVNSNAVSTAARDTIMDVGVDSSGGTSYNILIPDLLVSAASPYLGAFGIGINYFFPIWIKAGSSIAVRGSVNNATVGTFKCWMRAWGNPTDKQTILVGTKVKSYGINSGTSAGTSVTSGTTSEGSWTSLGAVSSGDNPWFWQYGLGANQGTITATGYAADLGIGNGSNKVVVDEQRFWQGTTVEQWYDSGASMSGYYRANGGNDTVYGRIQCSGTAFSGISMAAYGVI